MAGSFVVGLGAGVVILLVVWTLVLVAWVQLSAHHSGLRSLITLLSILLTAILLLIPTADKLGAEEDKPTPATHPDLFSPLDAFEVGNQFTQDKDRHLLFDLFRCTTTCSSGKEF